DGQWGVADVADCVTGAQYLAGRGLVDSQRMAIRGSSAGGFSCLCALTFWEVFRAGASYYGISDLEALARDTHKFESHYTDRLVGPYPKRRDLYRERSPIHSVERLSAPLIVFQGLQDNIVPPDQAERMVEAVRAKGLPVAYLTFADEGHGFRNPANSKRALEAELYFYSRCFGFTAADELEPIAIDNLAATP
ncbi:MAG TPA: prolyl oligopeptidase family serine peptidase, partial [Terriglobales bacterium]|nr:prolyl oligopeptidase family serine peptidase [Terriglobales bacterium]